MSNNFQAQPVSDEPDPYASLCSRCQHSQIESSKFFDQFDRQHEQILVHCLRIHETIFWVPDGLFGQTHAVCRLPEICSGFREQKEQQQQGDADGLTSEVSEALRAFQNWADRT